MRPSSWRMVFLLLLLAFVALVRLPVIHGGFFHPDEEIAEAVVANIQRTGRIDTNWANAPDMPTVFKYTQHNFAGYYVALTGWELIAEETFLGAVRPIDRFRLFSALFFLLSVLLTFALGWSIADSTLCGAIAGILTALSVQLFQDSLFARPEAFCTALGLLVVLLLVTAEKSDRPQRFILAAAALSGFLFSIKVSLIGYLPLVLVALILGRRSQTKGRPTTIAAVVPWLAVALILFLLGAWLGMPNATVPEYLSGLEALRDQYAGHHWPHGLGPSATVMERAVHGGSFLIDTVGLPVLALAVIGFAAALYQRRLMVICSIGLGLAYVIYFISTPVFIERNFSHALPLLFVSAALGVRQLSLLFTNSRARLAGVVLLVAAALTPPVGVWAKLRFEVLSGAYYRERDAAIEELRNDCQCEVLRFRADYDGADAALSLNGPVIIQVLDFGEYRTPPRSAVGTRVWDILANRANHGFEVVRIQGPFHSVTTSTLHTYHAADEVFIKVPRRRPDADSASVSIVSKEPLVAHGEPGMVVTSNGWSKAGQNPELRLDPPEVAYGSWNGSDKNRGEIQIDMGSCKTLTVKRGLGSNSVTASKKQTLAVRWTENGRPAELIAPNTPLSRRKWIVYRFDLPEGAKSVQVVARDDGDGEGAWSAITVPQCIQS